MSTTAFIKHSDESKEHHGKGDKETYEVIQALFFMVAFSSSLGILASDKVFSNFEIESLIAEFFILVVVIATYTINYHMMAYCCKLSSQDYNYAEFLEDRFGKIAAMVYDILMTIHNVILLAYIQRQITIAMFSDGNHDYDKSYYSLALINIPLIFISLTSDFKKIKWFCIVLIITWIYLFTGAAVQVIESDDPYEPQFVNEHGFGSWVVKLIGLQIYFASAFQSLPFIYKEVKKEERMKNVINISAVVTLVIYFTVYMSTTFVIVHDSYNNLKNAGIVLIGACSVVVNVIPARFALAQFLSGNDANTMEKASASDRLYSVLLIMGSIVLSLFLVNSNIWNNVIGLGIFLTCTLGIAVPPVIILFTDYFKSLLRGNETGKKISLFAYLTWIAILSITGIVGAFYIMIEGQKQSSQPNEPNQPNLVN